MRWGAAEITTPGSLIIPRSQVRALPAPLAFAQVRRQISPSGGSAPRTAGGPMLTLCSQSTPRHDAVQSRTRPYCAGRRPGAGRDVSPDLPGCGATRSHHRRHGSARAGGAERRDERAPPGVRHRGTGFTYAWRDARGGSSRAQAPRATGGGDREPRWDAAGRRRLVAPVPGWPSLGVDAAVLGPCTTPDALARGGPCCRPAPEATAPTSG